MDNFSEPDLMKALFQLCCENEKAGSSRKEKANTKNSEEQRKEAFEKAERAHLARKISQPAEVWEIKRFLLTEKQEDMLIREFIGSSHYHSTQCTMAMEGKPLSILVQMDNGLIYMAAMTKTLDVRWPGSVSNETWCQMEKASAGLLQFHEGEKSSKPTILADTTQYNLLLYPLHSDKDIHKDDWLKVGWPPDLDIEHYISPKDGVGCRVFHGFSLDTSFDPLINMDFLAIIDFPPHMKRLFSKIQKYYDRVSHEKTFGKTIFTRFNPNVPPQAHGHTIPIFPGEKHQYFEIPAVRFVNPNRKSPLQVIHRPVHKLTKQNIHE